MAQTIKINVSGTKLSVDSTTPLKELTLSQLNYIRLQFVFGSGGNADEWDGGDLDHQVIFTDGTCQLIAPCVTESGIDYYYVPPQVLSAVGRDVRVGLRGYTLDDGEYTFILGTRWLYLGKVASAPTEAAEQATADLFPGDVVFAGNIKTHDPVEDDDVATKRYVDTHGGGGGGGSVKSVNRQAPDENGNVLLGSNSIGVDSPVSWLMPAASVNSALNMLANGKQDKLAAGTYFVDITDEYIASGYTSPIEYMQRTDDGERLVMQTGLYIIRDAGYSEDMYKVYNEGVCGYIISVSFSEGFMYINTYSLFDGVWTNSAYVSLDEDILIDFSSASDSVKIIGLTTDEYDSSSAATKGYVDAAIAAAIGSAIGGAY